MLHQRIFRCLLPNMKVKLIFEGEHNPCQARNLGRRISASCSKLIHCPITSVPRLTKFLNGYTLAQFSRKIK
jgi:hypothetical protein